MSKEYNKILEAYVNNKRSPAAAAAAASSSADEDEDDGDCCGVCGIELESDGSCNYCSNEEAEEKNEEHAERSAKRQTRVQFQEGRVTDLF